MNGFLATANADEIVLHYERSLVAGETQHAENIKTAHADLLSRFESVDERLARK
jgi:hypothetical protein